jgi:GT2 family glycosyltransferase/glycosyltransferase involved in cell wall biosynthesis
VNVVRRIIEWVRERNHVRLARRHATRAGQPEFPSNYQTAAPPVAPTRDEWDALMAALRVRPATRHPVVDVVIPVYGGADATLRCLYTVLAAAVTTPHAVIVIDDASPDEGLTAELRRLAVAGLIELSRNERNLGFVATCNRGMSLHPDRDVVLLNADTEVYGNWLDRLRATALREKKVGTVTPLSTNATICSYPYFVRDNDMTLELEYAELDRLAARVNAGESCPVPTAVGFCMYVRRACLDDVGPFDVERFGRGYGEENDFCLRGSARGWRHLMALDVFVRHAGGVSFGAEKDARIAQALAEIAKRFPDYSAQVARFVEEDPTREARARLDLARLARRRSPAGAILFVTHDWGGGIERHVEDLCERLETEDVSIFFLRAAAGKPHRAVLSHPGVGPTPNIGPFDVHADVRPLVDALRALGIGHVHVHSLVGFDQPLAARWIPRVARSLGVSYDFTAHDYLCICPRMNLIDASGSYCGEPAREGCERCVAQNGTPFGAVSVREWRSAYERLLRGARAVIAPGRDVADRVARHFPGVKLTVRTHLEDLVTLSASKAAPRRINGEALRVAVIGAIRPHKGFDVLRECARDAALRRLPITFRLVGYSSDDEALKRWGNVEVLGRYDAAELPRLLAAERCHCALFPSVWPETHSYTLSAAIAAGLHPVSFDLGVPAERIRALGWGTVIPRDATPRAVNDALLSIDLRAGPDPRKVQAHFPACASVVRDYYGLPRLSPRSGG